MDEGSWLSYLIIIFLLFCAAYFAVAEMAFASVNRMKIKSRLDRGEQQAKRAMYVLDNFERAITTILIGTNIVHISAAALVTVLVTRRWGVSAVSISTLITTIVVFFIGEMLPKSIGKKYSERFSLSFASSLCFFMRLFTPLSAILTAIGSGVAKLTKGDAQVTVTEDELYDIIENMKDDGDLDAQRGDLVHSALLFGDVTAESILTSRVDIAAINVEDDCRSILAFIKQQRHSRLPVYRGSIDNIIGTLQIRKYIRAWMKQGDSVQIGPLLDEAYFVHQSINIDELLQLMSKKKLNMAIVTDNYGGTCGIVTVEDILEELVGDIWDEDDVVVESFTSLSDGSYEVSPDLDMEETFERLDYEDPEHTEWEHKLLGEWAYENFGHIPNEGDSFRYHDLVFTATAIKQHRIMKLQVRILPHTEENEGGEPA